MHVMANHYVKIDGTDSVYMHLHLYHRHTHYHAPRIKNSLISTYSISIIIRHYPCYMVSGVEKVG